MIEVIPRRAVSVAARKQLLYTEFKRIQEAAGIR